MKQGIVVLMLGLFFGLMVQGAGAADVQMNGNVGVSGSVTASSFIGNGSGLTNLVGLSDGSVTPGKIAFYGQVAIVATVGGDYTNPATAMAGYEAWCGTPSAQHPCLLKIMPGVYDVGTSPVVMQQYIDIEGSGEKTTKITGAVTNGGAPLTNGTINGASNAELRFLTVENTGGGTHTAALLNWSASPSILHVTASASGGITSCYGIYNMSSSPVMTNVTASGSGETYSYGVYNANGSPVMTNVTASGLGVSGSINSIGVLNISHAIMTNVTASGLGGSTSRGVLSEHSGTVKINHSVIRGTTYTVVNTLGVTQPLGPGPTTRVANTQLDGGSASILGGTLTCVGAYDGNYVALNTNCQVVVP